MRGPLRTRLRELRGHERPGLTGSPRSPLRGAVDNAPFLSPSPDGRRLVLPRPRHGRLGGQEGVATRLAETATVTFQIVGPITRSTFREESPDPVEEAINDVLHWSWSTRLQMGRFGQSLGGELDAWAKGPRIRGRRQSSGTSYDEHVLLVAAANLDRALRRAPKPVLVEAKLPESWRRALRLLRNIYEHWDDLRAAYRSKGRQLCGSAEKLRTEFPRADPWSFSFDPKNGEVVIASVVPLGPLCRELRLLEARMLRLERRRKRAQSRERSQETRNEPPG